MINNNPPQGGIKTKLQVLTLGLKKEALFSYKFREMKTIKTIALILFLGVSSSFAQGTKINFEQFTLKNGLHVILHQDKSTPIVAVSVLYHVGSKNENPERTGFAHFFEHLLFEGSVNIKRGEFDKYIENSGGAMNANTTQDRTFYYEILPSNQLELGLWLESERMLHAKVENIGIETQRQVVKEERRLRVDNQPYGTLIENIFKRAFTTHPYNWSVIGSMDHLDAAEEKDYKDFYKNFYVPNNAVLSIAGDLDITTTKKLVEKYFGDIPKGAPVAQPNVVEPPLKREVRDTIYDNVQMPMVAMAYRIPGQGTPDAYALELVAKLLSGGESARLNKRLVDEQEKALFVGSFAYTLEDAGLNIFYGIPATNITPLQLEQEVEKQIDALINEDISDSEFQKLINQTESDVVSNLGSVVGIAESLANYHTYYGDANLINTEINRYLKVTKADLKRVAKQYFVPQNRVVLYYLPKPTN